MCGHEYVCKVFLASCCTRRLFYKPYKKPSSKELPPTISATKNLCHGHEHVWKAFLSSCCTRRFCYKALSTKIGELNQELLPPRTSATDIRMFAKCSFQAASWEGSPTKLTRNLLQRTSTKNFCHQEHAANMNMSAKFSNQDAAREGSPTRLTRNVLQRTSTKNFYHQELLPRTW